MNVPDLTIHHYDVDIGPGTIPITLNRDIIETMIKEFPKVFTNKPVYDGRKNMYSKEPLPIGNNKQVFPWCKN